MTKGSLLAAIVIFELVAGRLLNLLDEVLLLLVQSIYFLLLLRNQFGHG